MVIQFYDRAVERRRGWKAAVRYCAVAQQIRDRIADGEYVEGMALPSEALLMETFRVSRMTVRRALGLLREEGLVGTRRGRVAWVRARPVRQRVVLDAGCTVVARMPSADERAALG